MREKLLISISAQQATAAHWRAGKIDRLQQFAHDEKGHAAFRDFLAPHANVPVFIMVDAVEEDYRFETLPHSWGSERAQMVSRKLKQHYRNTPFMGTWLQGRESDKRRDDRFLFSSLTNPDLLSDWLRVIGGQELPIAAIYLLPMVSLALVEKLQVKSRNLLLAAQHSGGLRLTFFRDRQFRLSRLTRGDASKADPIRLFAGEISNTRLYLHALRTATLDEHLTVLLLDRNDDLAAVAAAITNENPALDCVRVGGADLCARLGMDPQTLSATPDAVYLQLLGLKAPACSIAPVSVTVGYRRYRARRAIYAACAGIGAAAAVWGVANTWQAYGVNAQTADIAAQVAVQDLQYRQITREFPPAPTNGENLKRAVEVAKAIRESAREPVPMMVLVSQALEASPEIVVRDITWRYGYSTEKAPEASATAPTGQNTPRGAPPPVRRQTAFLSGEIRDFKGNYRGAIQTINSLADRLRGHPSVAEVRLIKMPLDVSPKAVLSGNTLESRTEPGSAQFELSVVLKAKI